MCRKESSGILSNAGICEHKVHTPVFGENLVEDGCLLLVLGYVCLVEGCIVECGCCGFAALFVATDYVDFPVCGAVKTLGDVEAYAACFVMLGTSFGALLIFFMLWGCFLQPPVSIAT
jgi:hypothetical protein